MEQAAATMKAEVEVLRQEIWINKITPMCAQIDSLQVQLNEAQAKIMEQQQAFEKHGTQMNQTLIQMNAEWDRRMKGEIKKLEDEWKNRSRENAAKTNASDFDHKALERPDKFSGKNRCKFIEWM